MIKPYFETKLGKLYHGDCLEIMPELEPVDLVLTDPPYGIGEDGGKHFEWKSTPNSIGKDPKYEKMGWDNIRPSKTVFNKMIQISNDQIFWGGHYFSDYLKPSGKWFVWDKLIEIEIFTSCELAWTSFSGNTIRRFKMHPFSGLSGGKNKQHPTQKPIGLMIWCVELSKTSGIILDPFLGSGTTAIACERLNRRWIGIEIEERYCEISAKRIEKERSQLKLWA